MRQQIINALHRRMAHDKSLFFVIADVGINLVEPIARDYPDRFVNVGIAEQNMIGVCAGLANAGHHPVCYTITNFCVHRCLEQVRDEVALHDYPVIILGSTVGFENSSLGPTHHIVDDFGAMRAIHGIEIHCPSSVPYAEPLLDDLVDRGVAAFVRIPKGEFAQPESAEPVVHLPGTQSDTLLATYGGTVRACLQAQQIDPRLSVMVFNRLRPIDDEAVAAIWSRYDRLVVVEDHFAETGLYSTACQILAKHRQPMIIESRAPSEYCFEVGNGPEHFWKKYGIDARGAGPGFRRRAAFQRVGSRLAGTPNLRHRSPTRQRGEQVGWAELASPTKNSSGGTCASDLDYFQLRTVAFQRLLQRVDELPQACREGDHDPARQHVQRSDLELLKLRVRAQHVHKGGIVPALPHHPFFRFPNGRGRLRKPENAVRLCERIPVALQEQPGIKMDIAIPELFLELARQGQRLAAEHRGTTARPLSCSNRARTFATVPSRCGAANGGSPKS